MNFSKFSDFKATQESTGVNTSQRESHHRNCDGATSNCKTAHREAKEPDEVSLRSLSHVFRFPPKVAPLCDSLGLVEAAPTLQMFHKAPSPQVFRTLRTLKTTSLEYPTILYFSSGRMRHRTPGRSASLLGLPKGVTSSSTKVSQKDMSHCLISSCLTSSWTARMVKPSHPQWQFGFLDRN